MLPQKDQHMVAKVLHPDRRNQIAREFKSTHF